MSDTIETLKRDQRLHKLVADALVKDRNSSMQLLDLVLKFKETIGDVSQYCDKETSIEEPKLDEESSETISNEVLLKRIRRRCSSYDTNSSEEGSYCDCVRIADNEDISESERTNESESSDDISPMPDRENSFSSTCSDETSEDLTSPREKSNSSDESDESSSGTDYWEPLSDVKLSHPTCESMMLNLAVEKSNRKNYRVTVNLAVGNLITWRTFRVASEMKFFDFIEWMARAKDYSTRSELFIEFIYGDDIRFNIKTRDNTCVFTNTGTCVWVPENVGEFFTHNPLFSYAAKKRFLSQKKVPQDLDGLVIAPPEKGEFTVTFPRSALFDDVTIGFPFTNAVVMALARETQSPVPWECARYYTGPDTYIDVVLDEDPDRVYLVAPDDGKNLLVLSNGTIEAINMAMRCVCMEYMYRDVCSH